MPTTGAGRDYAYDSTIKLGPGSGGAFIGEQRVNRTRWWLYSIGGLAAYICLFILAIALINATGLDGFAYLAILGWWAAAIYWFNLNARRFHDMGRSGWHVLWLFFPLIGPLIIIVWCGFGPSDPTTNKWGAPRT